MQVEVLSGPERRRRWSAEEKARVVAEAGQSGVTIADVARRHGISRSQIYTWRREGSLQPAVGDEVGPPPELVPVVLQDIGAAAAPRSDGSKVRSGPQPKGCGVIEVVLPGDIRVVVRGGVEEQALRAVLSALRSA
jgi:transposase